MKDRAVDMDRYPSVVLIEAFDRSVPNAFEKNLIQVSLSVPLFGCKASYWLGGDGFGSNLPNDRRTEFVLPCATLS